MTVYEHIFTPVVTIQLQPDGAYLATVDWSESYKYAYDEEKGVCDESGDLPESRAACDAVDAWVKPPSTDTFIIPAATKETTT